MTTTDVLRILWRRWYVVLAGLLLVVLAVHLVLSRPPVYFTEVQLQLVPPEGPGRGLSDRSAGLIALAGLVERTADVNSDVEVPVSPDVTIVDMGIGEGVLVVQPDSGGQWSVNFTSPVLQVQAVDPSPAGAEERREATVAIVLETLRDVQLGQGVEPAQLVVARKIPDSPRVVASSGPVARASGVAALLGLVITVLAAVHTDHHLARRLRRRGFAVPGSATSA